MHYWGYCFASRLTRDSFYFTLEFGKISTFFCSILTCIGSHFSEFNCKHNFLALLPVAQMQLFFLVDTNGDEQLICSVHVVNGYFQEKWPLKARQRSTIYPNLNDFGKLPLDNVPDYFHATCNFTSFYNEEFSIL